MKLDLTTKDVEVYVYTEPNGVHEVAMIFEYPKAEKTYHEPEDRSLSGEFRRRRSGQAILRWGDGDRRGCVAGRWRRRGATAADLEQRPNRRRSTGPSNRATPRPFIPDFAQSRLRGRPSRSIPRAGWSSPGSFDPETNLIALELHDRDPNIGPDHDLLRLLAGQNQHSNLLAVRLA